MAYKKHKYGLLFRFLLIAVCVAGIIIAYINNIDYATAIAIILTIILFFNLYYFVNKRLTEVDNFLESVKYRDFSRWFNEKSGNKGVQELHKKFNDVIRTIKEMNKEKEVQYIYLQHVLELVDTGIIAYNIRTGTVLLVNNAFKKIIDVPTFKKVSFIKDRKQDFYQKIFKKDYREATSLSINVDKERIKVLVSDSIFKIEEDRYKVIVIQNIEETIDHTESEAWKKLLSVMTHEIMNSIAPISSLAETLQNHIRASIENPNENQLEMEDLQLGIESIKKRSEGLMMFAKTYRSLHKITHLNLSLVTVKDLFENIKNLMESPLRKKEVALIFKLKNPELKINMDLSLIEQVLINLILNTLDATEKMSDGEVKVSGFKNTKGHTIIQVADNGKGIPEDILDRIFIPFFTTKKKGSGVGLSLGKQIMLLHKGKIQVNSIENKGTVVNLIFYKDVNGSVN